MRKNIKIFTRKPAYALFALLGVAPIHAQITENKQPEREIQRLQTVVVTASGLDTPADELSTPNHTRKGIEWLQQRGATLGESLSKELGIASTAFAPGASRPIIRGMDGARVRIMSNGLEIADASTVSPDHAVTIDPMLVEQVEILRGPSVLAYGGGAIGGVVNVVDTLIATIRPEKSLSGKLETRAESADKSYAGAFSASAGNGPLVLRVEGVKRKAEDYRAGSGWQNDEGGRTVEGSHSASDSVGLGLSWIGDRGHLGASFTRQRSDYGIPGHSHAFEGCHPHGDHLHCGSHGHEEEHDEHDHEHEHDDHEVPFVKLKSDRTRVEGALREPFNGFSKVSFKSSFTNYRHDEIEGESVSTTFKNKARDSRFELTHHPVMGWRGVFGLQYGTRDFEATGEEAYVLPTDTRKQALYLLEERRIGDLRLEAGIRHEQQRIDLHAVDAQQRKHSGTSISAGANWQFMPGYILAFNASNSNRLPTAEELFADGLHLGTATYELGNANLRRETAKNIDLSLRKTAGDTTFELTAFHNNIKNYIYAHTLDEHDGLQLIEYRQRDARFTGLEASLRQQLGQHFAVTVFGDLVHARLQHVETDANRNLPRIPASRIGTRLQANWSNWQGGLEVYRVSRQTRVADYETSTSGYTLLNLELSYRAAMQSIPFTFYLKGNNLTDKLAYNHTSFTKNAVPLMGRNFVAGLRVEF